MFTILQVALGGALGASARYLTGVAIARVLGTGFPWGTLTVNFVGSFLMGVLAIALAQYDAMRFSPLLMTGLLGGFTTYSAFSLDALDLFERGDVALAALYVVGTVILALGGLAIGMLLAKGVWS